MADATPTPPVHGTPTPSVPGFKGFLTKDLAGMPTWVWIVIVGAGIAAAYVIPKILASKGNATTTGTTPTSGLGLAIDPTTGLPYAVEGLVPSGNTPPGNTTPPIPPQPNPPPPTFVWPTSLAGQQIWQGTQSHNFFFGPKGPQPDEKGQTLLSTLFPAGTTFADLIPGQGGAGASFTYTVPGGQPITAPVTLVNPNPPSEGGHSSGPPMAQEMIPTWPGSNTTQIRMV